jgi:hypothetical protein
VAKEPLPQDCPGFHDSSNDLINIRKLRRQKLPIVTTDLWAAVNHRSNQFESSKNRADVGLAVPSIPFQAPA